MTTHIHIHMTQDRKHKAKDGTFQPGDMVKGRHQGADPVEVVKVVGNMVYVANGEVYHTSKLVAASSKDSGLFGVVKKLPDGYSIIEEGKGYALVRGVKEGKILFSATTERAVLAAYNKNYGYASKAKDHYEN